MAVQETWLISGIFEFLRELQNVAEVQLALADILLN